MAGVKKAVYSRRYTIAKAITALEEVLASGYQEVASSKGFSAVVTKACDIFKEAYSKQLTSVICMTGAAMAPTLNARALKDSSAYEKLVMRNMPRPGSRNIGVGDVVAFYSPIASPGSLPEHNVMVRRIAALEGHQMVSDNSDEESFQIPPGHCWLLADNENISPPAVIDSRTFGHLPVSNIIGRIIYFASSRTDHGPVVNSVASTEADRPIVEGEVDVDELFPASKSEESSSEQNSS